MDELMTWKTVLNGDLLPWLLEPNSENPGVRYFALTELLAWPHDAPDVIAATEAAMTGGPVPLILSQQKPDGRWSG